MDNQPAYDELLEEIACLKQQLAELTAENRELTQLSNTDGLTGLYNHRFMMERGEEEFRRAKRYNSGFSCVLLDIDHFKAFNDTYGHQFGDHVLKKLGVLLKENTRATDACGRYGGEEFIILIPQPIEEAGEYILRLHALIAAQEFSHGDIRARITVSIGLADFCCEMESWHEIIARADHVLYQAKNCGRNMVRIWTSPSQKKAEVVDEGNIRKDITLLAKEFPFVLHHHEGFDGPGYTRQSREIPLGARVLAINDVFDAMTTSRTFKAK